MECPICNEVLDNSLKRYCSPKCRHKAYKLRHRERDLKARRIYSKKKVKEGYYREWYANNKKVEIKARPCEYCEKEFIPDWRHNSQKFCSKKCRLKDRNRKKEYWDNRDKIIKHVTEYKERISFGKSGKSNLRRQALKRDNHTCQHCGSKEKLVVHHLRYPAEKVEYLQTLCRSCHAAVHRTDSSRKFVPLS